MDFWDHDSERPLREIPRGGDNQAFLLKALNEAGNELEGEFYNLRPRQLRWRPDDGWSLIEIAGHLRDNEAHLLSSLRAIISSRTPLLTIIDLEDLVLQGDYQSANIRELLDEYGELRQRVLYLLHRLSSHQWRRHGEHPYRGPVSVLHLARELNEHDLDHLWQVKRLKEARP